MSRPASTDIRDKALTCRSKEIGQDIVTVKVGPEETPFNVHKDLLTSCSPYFKAAFEGRFREASDKTIALPDVTKTHFASFLDWLYFKRLPTRTFNTPGQDCNVCKAFGVDCKEQLAKIKDRAHNNLCTFVSISEDEDRRLESLVENLSSGQVYLFADRYNVPALRQLIVDQCWTWTSNKKSIMAMGSLILTLQNLPFSSVFCRLLVDVYVENYKPYMHTDCGTAILLRQKIPTEFIYTVMSDLASLNFKADEPKKVIKNLCAYHEHPQDEESIKACPGADKVRK